MEVSLVKAGKGATWHRAWVRRADGSSGLAEVFLPHDIWHLVVESALDFDHGFWGVLASGGWKRQEQMARARNRRKAAAAVSHVAGDAPAHPDEVGLAEAAVYAIANQFGDGPDDLAGVRERLRRHGIDELSRMADDLDDDRLGAIRSKVAAFMTSWNSLAEGETLRVDWPVSM